MRVCIYESCIVKAGKGHPQITKKGHIQGGLNQDNSSKKQTNNSSGKTWESSVSSTRPTHKLMLRTEVVRGESKSFIVKCSFSL